MNVDSDGSEPDSVTLTPAERFLALVGAFFVFLGALVGAFFVFLGALAGTPIGRWVVYLALASGGILSWHDLTHQKGEAWDVYGLYHLPWYIAVLLVARPRLPRRISKFLGVTTGVCRTTCDRGERGIWKCVKEEHVFGRHLHRNEDGTTVLWRRA